MVHSSPSRPTHTKRRWMWLLLSLIALYVIVPQLGGFQHSFQALEHVRLGWLAVAVIAQAATYLCAAFTYLFLARHVIPFWRTTLVQLAGSFTNKLLPAGIGGIGINYQYLKKSGNKREEAVAAVSANNTLGFIGNALLVLVLAQTSAPLHLGHLPHVSHLLLLSLVGALIVATVIVLLWRSRRLQASVLMVLNQLRRYRLAQVLPALAGSMALTACFGLTLYASAAAVGVHLALFSALMVMTLGVIGGTVTPTPGGLGGAEAGLVAGLVLYGLGSADALAVALLYRLCTFWLPFLIGGLGFIVVERRRLI